MIHSLSDKVPLTTVNKNSRIQGLGVFSNSLTKIPLRSLKNGIINGYRLIDTAQIYGNEVGTGIGIKEGLAATGLSREELFVTSKVWNNHLTYDETIKAFEETLNRLALDYLDLYLIHWPGKMPSKNLGRL